MRPTNSRRLVFQPGSYASLQSGANQIVNAIRPTLGPLPRVVAIDRILDTRIPELLDNGGTIAKRIIQLRDMHADVGAMYVRDCLWQLQDQEGDGTATAAVIFQSVFNQGVRHVAGGYNARRLQTYLEEGARLVLAELTRMTAAVNGKERLAQAAYTVCQDAELSDLLGEIFDIVGEYGRLEIREDSGRGLEREYVEGMYWEKGLLSRELIADWTRVRSELEDAAVFISDLSLREPEDLLPILVCALKNERRRLLIIANEISDSAMSLLLANNRKPEEFQVLAVHTPGHGAEEQAWFLTDAAILCGGRPYIREAGDHPRGLRPEHFGRARRVWASRENFGIIGGRGDPRMLRRHIAELQQTFEDSLDVVYRSKLEKRIGKLLGGSATLRIGGVSEHEIEERKERAERTALAVRGALREGALPGGGAALLACRPALHERLRQAADDEEAAAYRILIDTVAEPMRALAANAGYNPALAVGEAEAGGTGFGFDVLRGEAVHMTEAGILDPASVQKAAAVTGITSAALALTIDVLVHRPDQPARASVRPPSKRKRL
ncbi:MAG: TCP-1/cpn60 chaperonin family protein [Chloroflexota bacterium]|nr:TCP-1/cpn60 chaperonin family protein [Chloroflexota bacterium]